MSISKPLFKSIGFAIIELIVVILIISILAVTIAPKFFDSNGYEKFTYQAEIITKLRSIQLRAMQQTNSSECHTVLVTEVTLGIPENCDLTLTDGWQGENKVTGESGTTNIKIEDNHEVTFAPTGFSFTFDSMGRPSCTSCLITVIGGSTLTIKIESEGYIHEG
ncbi:MAG: type II secretion system protein [Colwellia sp.]|nr:type II secretion system protein [Colwellia sp.]